MDFLIRFTNVVTLGNMATFALLVCGGIYYYYRVRRYLAKQHSDFVEYLNSLTEAQTKRIEDCIHKLPGHPEIVKPVLPVIPVEIHSDISGKP